MFVFSSMVSLRKRRLLGNNAKNARTEWRKYEAPRRPVWALLAKRYKVLVCMCRWNRSYSNIADQIKRIKQAFKCSWFLLLHIFFSFNAVDLGFHPSLPFHFFAIVPIISIVLLESQKVKFVDRLTTLDRCSPGVIGILPLVHPHLLIWKILLLSFVVVFFLLNHSNLGWTVEWLDEQKHYKPQCLHLISKDKWVDTFERISNNI